MEQQILSSTALLLLSRSNWFDSVHSKAIISFQAVATTIEALLLKGIAVLVD